MHDEYDLSGLSKEAAEHFKKYLEGIDSEENITKTIKKEEARRASSLHEQKEKKEEKETTVESILLSDLSGLNEEAIRSFTSFVERQENVTIAPTVYTSPTKISELPRKRAAQATAKIVGSETLTDGSSALAPSFQTEPEEAREEAASEEKAKNANLDEEDFKFEPLPIKRRTKSKIESRPEDFKFEKLGTPKKITGKKVITGNFRYIPLEDEDFTMPQSRLSEEEQERMVQEISENLEKQFKKEDEERRQAKKVKEAEKKTEKPEKKKRSKKTIKSARGKANRYVPHKKRSIWERIGHMTKYGWGYYDDLEDINPAELNDGERELYWEEVEELEDAQHDYDSVQAKKTAFLSGLAAIGIGFVIVTGVSLYNDVKDGTFFHMPTNQESQIPATEIVTLVKGETNLKLEENRARGKLMKFEDQDYLRSRINENFIPENATEDEMLDIMQEAWRTLEPDVQKWVREPYRVREAELRRAEEEAQREANRAEIESRNANHQTEEKELEIGE